MNFYENAEKSAGTTTGCTDPTNDFVQSTSKFWRQPEILICDMMTHVTHLVRLLRWLPTTGNPITVEPLRSILEIANVIQLLSVEDAILIAKSEILCLNDISLDGDIADDVSL